METIAETALAQTALDKLHWYMMGAVVLTSAEAGALLGLVEAWRWERT
jgi:hypothetical protein